MHGDNAAFRDLSADEEVGPATYFHAPQVLDGLWLSEDDDVRELPSLSPASCTEVFLTMTS